jgi:hypothetical protein
MTGVPRAGKCNMKDTRRMFRMSNSGALMYNKKFINDY